jgi:hypothetical protein
MQCSYHPFPLQIRAPYTIHGIQSSPPPPPPQPPNYRDLLCNSRAQLCLYSAIPVLYPSLPVQFSCSITSYNVPNPRHASSVLYPLYPRHHRVGRVLSRRNWDSPNPSPAGECPPPPPPVLGRGEHSLAREGLGESDEGTYVHYGTLCIYVLCARQSCALLQIPCSIVLSR